MAKRTKRFPLSPDVEPSDWPELRLKTSSQIHRANIQKQVVLATRNGDSKLKNSEKYTNNGAFSST
jgi:hypothetical protein